MYPILLYNTVIINLSISLKKDKPKKFYKKTLKIKL